jgi:hypothetical protein
MRKLIFSFILALGSSAALAEDINVRAALDAKLSKLRDFSLPDACTQVQVGTRTVHHSRYRRTGNMDIDSVDVGTDLQEPVMETRCVPVMGKLRSGEVKIDSIVFDKMDVVKNALPTKVDAQAVISINCSESEQRSSADFTFSRRHSTSVTTTHGITNTLAVNTKVTFDYAKGVGGEFGASDTYQVQSSTSDQVVDEGSETKEYHLSVVIKQMSNFISQAKIIESTDRLQWHAVTIVDAPLSSNKEGKTQISELLSQDERRFPIEGYISNVHSGDVLIDYFSQSVTRAKCDERIKKGLPSSYKLNHLVIEPE